MNCYPFDAFGKPLALALRETPHPSASEVLVRVGSCGLCHSDLHLHEGFFDLGNGQRLDLSRGIAPPRVLGHEIAGTVVALGPQAEGVAVGERRVVYPWIGCGSCGSCTGGHEELCGRPRALGINRDGGFSDHVLVPHPRYLFAYDPLPESEACTCACSGLTAYSALKKCAPLGAGDTLLISGAGGVGLSGMGLAMAALDVQPVVAEIDRSKWDLALAAGAASCLDPTKAAATKAFMKANGGAAAAIDCVGAAATFSYGLSALRKRGGQAGERGLVWRRDAAHARDAAAARGHDHRLLCRQLGRNGRADGAGAPRRFARDAGIPAPAGRDQRGPGRLAQRCHSRPRRAAALTATHALKGQTSSALKTCASVASSAASAASYSGP